VSGRCEAALEQQQRLVRALGAECRAAEEIVERCVVLARVLGRREQVVGLLILALAHELLGAGDVGLLRQRHVRKDNGQPAGEQPPARVRT
jgi:hypothetical protein